ncbi:hypothetical protein [Ilumatobacter sp.]|uniref:hypothetical protein n=1 Tax=Ilumatobacter sp. TaxID=1967498 RepID=UPI003B5165B8
MSDALLPPPSGSSISPAPTDLEAVAIVAAMEALWPRPVVEVDGADDDRSRAWRFSGRWWNTPMPVRRARPYR